MEIQEIQDPKVEKVLSVYIKVQTLESVHRVNEEKTALMDLKGSQVYLDAKVTFT